MVFTYFNRDIALLIKVVIKKSLFERDFLFIKHFSKNLL